MKFCIIFLLTGKSEIYHLCPDEENVKVNDRKREIYMLKKESKLSIDDVLDQLPTGYLESRANELVEEVQFHIIVSCIL